ncbi:MAG TPA: CAP domain-containing protein [Edaphobacter sp.]|nr:CAP domain-containing protein [Edaphobacter sp.]
MMRRLGVVLLGFLMVASAAAKAQTDASPEERALLQMANQFRAQHGIAPLAWNSALARAARIHAKRMVSEGSIEHQYPGEPDLITRAAQAGAHFTAVAENLAGRGRAAAQLQYVWMNSPTHRANLLDPKMNVVGIGVIKSGGLLYAVEDFAQSVSVSKQGEIESRVSKALQSLGIPSVKVTEAARSNCRSQAETQGDAALVAHLEGPNPAELPDALVQRIKQGNYHSAAVGECSSANAGQGFTTYRVAVLLY